MSTVLDRLPWHSAHTVRIPGRWILLTSVIPWLSFLHHQKVDICESESESDSFCTDIYGSQTMYSTDFGDPLTFPLASSQDVYVVLVKKKKNGLRHNPGEGKIAYNVGWMKHGELEQSCAQVLIMMNHIEHWSAHWSAPCCVCILRVRKCVWHATACGK